MKRFAMSLALVCVTGVGLAGCGGAQAESVAERPPTWATIDNPRPVAEPLASPVLQNKSFSFEEGVFTQGGYARGQAPDGTASLRLRDQVLELAPDGRFFIAFDRDSPAQLELAATRSDGRVITHILNIAPREWQIQRLNIPKRGGGTSKAWWQRRKPEWEAIVAARAKETDARGWQQSFDWPVRGRISGRFGRQRIFQGEPANYHSGIDIAPGAGVPFNAPADGVVVLARSGFSLEGGLIIVDHGAGLNSAFLHASRIVVAEGERVSQGQQLGNVGATGRATGPHLHWSLKWRDARLDPLLFTGPMD
ncbi:MAG: M23 family metallopeptidase [Erythrobacter sp.]|nr:M23 family metallopeptidase [Erythrobacter sp.]